MLGKTIRIRGEITGDEDVHLDGQLDGKIELTKGLSLGKTAVVNAEIQAASVQVAGKFQGNILSAGRVEIDSAATVIGNITSSRISIADGAYFNGSVEMTARGDEDKR